VNIIYWKKIAAGKKLFTIFAAENIIELKYQNRIYIEKHIYDEKT
jgi:hypothetical protein